MERKTYFFKLSENVNLIILSFLELEDYLRLTYLDSFFNNLIARNPFLFTKAAISLYFPEAIDFFCEFTDYGGFNVDHKKKLDRLMKTPTRFWKNKLKLSKELKKSWLNLMYELTNNALQMINSEPVNIQFIVDFILETIRNPELPMSNLKRETVGKYCQTPFQNMLVEILALGSGKYMEDRLDFEIINFNNFLLENQKKFEQFHKNNEKQYLIEARWYIYENMNENINFLSESETEVQMREFQGNSSYNEDDILENEENSLLSSSIKFLNNINLSTKEDGLISFYNQLLVTLTNQASIIYQYLLQQDNPYDFVNEYCTRWKIYVASMINLETNLKEFINSINNVYENVFENFPSFPKFSIWRMMAKIWHKVIYQRLEEPLSACFKKLLKVYRQKNMNNMINHKKIMIKKDKKDNLDDIPLPLYISFKNNLKNRQSSFKLLRFNPAQYGSHEFFSSDVDHIGSLLFNYLNNMIDLSLNEINIHFLGHSELKFDYPYKFYEKNILSLTQRFYQDQYEVFYQTPELYQAFLDSDFLHLCKIGNHKLNYLLEKIKIQSWLCFFKHWCVKQLERKNQESISEISIIENKSKEIIQEIVKENYEDLFIQSELYKSSGFLQESQEFLKLSNFTVKKMNEIQEEEEDSSLSNYKIDELPRFQKSEVSGSSFKGMEIKEETMKEKTTLIYQAVLEKFKGYNPYSTYSEMKEKLAFLKEEKLVIDLELEDINHSRRIPKDLEDSAENFYNITREISREFLYKVLREYNEPKKNCEGKSMEERSRADEEMKENCLPHLILKNNSQSYQSNQEFDRLGLKKEKSESCSSNKKDF